MQKSISDCMIQKNLEAHELEQQKTTPGTTPVSLKQETEATILRRKDVRSDESQFLLKHSDG